MPWFGIFHSKATAPDSPPSLFGEKANDQEARTSHLGLSILGTLLGFLIGAFSSSLCLGLGGAILLHRRGHPKETIKITMIAIASLGGLYGAYIVFKDRSDLFVQNFFRGRKAQDPDF